jgi:hypothetical protein
MSSEFIEWLKLAAHQKLLFKVPAGLRCLFMSTTALPTLCLLAYFDHVPSEKDRELISDVACELAGEFMEIHEYHIDNRFSGAPFEELEKLDYWLYVRAEEEPTG